MSRLRLVTLAGDSEREATLAAALNRRTDVELVLRCVDRVELLASLRGAGLDAVVSVGAPAWFDHQEADEANRRRVAIVGVVSDAPDADRLAALGASLVPASAPVEEVVARCSSPGPASPPPPPVAAGPAGRMIAVWGPKGAPGRTTVAVELAHGLAAADPETLLLDADPYGGDILQRLAIIEELPTVVWAARMAAKGELDAARLHLDLRRAGRTGPVVLPGLPRADLWADVSEFGWRELLAAACGAFRDVVCDVGFCLEPDASPLTDTGEGRNRMARIAVSSADHVVAVFRADPIGIKNFLWSFDDLRGLTETDSVVIVANRVQRGEEREVGEILKRHAGRRPVAYIPDRPAELKRAVGKGEPVLTAAPGSDITAVVRGLMASLGGRVGSRGLLARLSGRRG